MSVLSESFDLAAEAGELVLDAQLGEGILKEIPVLSSAIGIAQLGRTVSDRIFFAKVRRMLLNVEGVSDEQREKFYQRIHSDATYGKKVGECLVLVCDTLDDLEKAEMLGVLFAAHLRAAIDMDMFRRIATAIASGYVDDLLCFAISGSDPYGLVEPYMFRLIHTGLTSADARLNESPFGASVETDCGITKVGDAFLKAVGSHYEDRKMELEYLRKR